MFSMSCAVRDGLSATAMGMQQQGQSAGQLGLQYASPLGMLKAELISAGMVNVSLDGFQPLPFAQLNTQLAFVGGMLAGGQLHGVLMTPVGVLMGAANVYRGRVGCVPLVWPLEALARPRGPVTAAWSTVPNPRPLNFVPTRLRLNSGLGR